MHPGEALSGDKHSSHAKSHRLITLPAEGFHYACGENILTVGMLCESLLYCWLWQWILENLPGLTLWHHCQGALTLHTRLQSAGLILCVHRAAELTA